MMCPLTKEQIIEKDAEIARLAKRVVAERAATREVAAELVHKVTTQTRLLKLTLRKEGEGQ